jgi:riboflavin synthase
MFTGLIEEIGIVRGVRPQGSGARLTIEARLVMGDVRIDDSVSINGACQTVVSRTEWTFDVEAVEETIAKTTLGRFQTGKRVNLERALQLGSRLGGHIVQGHVDTRGTVTRIEQKQGSWLLTVAFPHEYERYVIPVGSICIDGVSLTTARVQGNHLTVSVIPHTWAHTTLGELASGAAVNLEFDVIGKYIEKMLSSGLSADRRPAPEPHSNSASSPAGMTESWLQSMGY